MNGEFLRGEVYYFRLGEAIGSEQGVRRPAVIVSSQKGNETSEVLNVAYMTSKSRFGVINVEVETAERRSWVMCNQIATLDKSRVLTYMGKLTDDEMADVDHGIRVALGLYDTDDEDESRDDVIADYEDRITELKHNGLAWQKLYEKALEELVSLRLGADLAKKEKFAPKKEVVPVPKKLVEVKLPEDEPTTYEINSCSEDDLRRCGCTPDMIRKIIARRPYAKIEDLRFVPGLTSTGYAILKAKLTCVPVITKKVEEPKPKKLKVNTMTAEDFMGLGIGEVSAKYIVRYIENHGPMKKVEELQACPRFGKRFMEKYGPMLEV